MAPKTAQADPKTAQEAPKTAQERLRMNFLYMHAAHLRVCVCVQCVLLKCVCILCVFCVCVCVYVWGHSRLCVCGGIRGACVF